jgi:high-affinity Fe2+/Pb2+ permease
MGGVEITALTILTGALVWFLKYTTRQNSKREEQSDKERAKRQDKRDEEQKEERDYYRKVIDGGMAKNAVLNTKGIILQKGMIKDLKDHNGHSEKFSEKVIETLSLQTDAITLVCEKLNGGSHSMIEAKRRLNKDRRKKDKPVEVERRT